MIPSWFEEARLGGSAVPTGPELQRTHGHMEGPGMKMGPPLRSALWTAQLAYHPHGPPSSRCLALADQLVRPLFAWQPRRPLHYRTIL
jgi:hypothetical protein